MSLQPFMIDRTGAVYSTNLYAGPDGRHELLRRSPAGKVEVIAGALPGRRDGRGTEASFCGIDGLDLDDDGAIYLTDRNMLRRVATDGMVTTVAGPFSAQSFGEDAMGVHVEAWGEVYVADYSGRRVVRVGEASRVTTIFTTGWVWAPTGVTRHNSATYVLEHLRMPLVILGNLKVGPYIRVRRVAVDGSSETLALVWGSYSWLAGVIGLGIVAGMLSVTRREIRRRRNHALV